MQLISRRAAEDAEKNHLDSIYRILFSQFPDETENGFILWSDFASWWRYSMVSAKNLAMSIHRLTRSFRLSSGKAEEIPVNPV